jgi:hypothetical protein
MRTLLRTLALLLPAAATHAAGWTNPVTIERAFTENSDLIAVYTVESGSYTPGCSTTAFLFRADSETRRSRAWATILSALTTGQKVQFWVTDTCGTWNYHDATAVMLHRN